MTCGDFSPEDHRPSNVAVYGRGEGLPEKLVLLLQMAIQVAAQTMHRIHLPHRTEHTISSFRPHTPVSEVIPCAPWINELISEASLHHSSPLHPSVHPGCALVCPSRTACTPTSGASVKADATLRGPPVAHLPT